MDFDNSKAYTLFNADQLKDGSKGYFHDNASTLKDIVRIDNKHWFGTVELNKGTDKDYPFRNKEEKTDWRYFYLVEEPKEPTERPCTREELVEMLKKQGMFLLKSHDGGIHTVISIANESLNFVAIANDDYDYDKLCETFTLLDGTELWVEE